MAARSIGSGTISFGLVTIPFRLYTAVSPKSVSFNMLHNKCGSRVKQQLLCPVDNVVINHADTVRGFEHARDQYVLFTDEELDSIKASRPSALVLEEFVPADTVDLLSIENTYYLGPDKGGDVGYVVLARALERANRIGVGRFAKQGKDVLVLLRPYRGGLIMHEAYYADEVRPWTDVELPRPNLPIRNEEEAMQMARLLIQQLETPRFDAANYRDEWAAKVLELVEKKKAGESVVAAPAPKAPVIDLLEALQKSVAANDAKLVEARREHPVKGPKKAAPRNAKSASKKKTRSGE